MVGFLNNCMVKILLNSGKVVSVLEAEATNLVDKGLCTLYEEVSKEQKSVKQDYEDKMMKKSPKNKKNAKS